MNREINFSPEETKLRRKLRSVQNKIKNIEEGKADDSELTLEELQAEKQRIGDDLNYIKVSFT